MPHMATGLTHNVGVQGQEQARRSPLATVPCNPGLGAGPQDGRQTEPLNIALSPTLTRAWRPHSAYRTCVGDHANTTTASPSETTTKAASELQPTRFSPAPVRRRVLACQPHRPARDPAADRQHQRPFPEGADRWRPKFLDLLERRAPPFRSSEHRMVGSTCPCVASGRFRYRRSFG